MYFHRRFFHNYLAEISHYCSLLRAGLILTIILSIPAHWVSCHPARRMGPPIYFTASERSPEYEINQYPLVRIPQYGPESDINTDMIPSYPWQRLPKYLEKRSYMTKRRRLGDFLANFLAGKGRGERDSAPPVSSLRFG